MQKKIFLVIYFLINSFLIKSQSFSYSFTKDSTSYTALTSPTIVTSNEDWKNKTFKITLPFQFNFCGTSTNSLTIETNGYIVFDVAKQLSIVAFNTFGCKKDNSQNFSASIGYVTTGSAGNRIVKLEFKNLSQFSLSNSDYLNYQIWIYENGNKIEFHIGANSYSQILDSQTPELLGILNKNMDTSDKAYLIGGDPSAPTSQLISGDNAFVYLNNVPSQGIVLQLSPTF